MSNRLFGRKKGYPIKQEKKKKFDYIFIFDGKERSILAAFFIKAKFKIALSPRIKFFYKIMRMKFFEDNENTSLNVIFQKYFYQLDILAIKNQMSVVLSGLKNQQK